MDACPGEMAIRLEHNLWSMVSLTEERNRRVIFKVVLRLTLRETTSVQVQTLERTLHDEFDPKRRLHGWVGPGITLDREDFIDLNNVSKRVPGKTPSEVSSPNHIYFQYTLADPHTISNS